MNACDVDVSRRSGEQEHITEERKIYYAGATKIRRLFFICYGKEFNIRDNTRACDMERKFEMTSRRP